jgi:hypothetical protein
MIYGLTEIEKGLEMAERERPIPDRLDPCGRIRLWSSSTIRQSFGNRSRRAGRPFFHGLIQLEQFNIFCYPDDCGHDVAANGRGPRADPRELRRCAPPREPRADDDLRHKFIVLDNCYIFFAHIWRDGDGAAMCEFRRRTEQFGGSSLVQFVPHCTHVIAQSMAAKGVQEAKGTAGSTSDGSASRVCISGGQMRPILHSGLNPWRRRGR